MAEQDEIRTLRILHLPPGLPDDRRDELFKLYGAVRTRTLRKSEKYTITFAEFPSAEHANQVFLELHQLPVKGKRLSIEFAKRNISAENTEDINYEEELKKKDEEELKNNTKNYQEYIKKLNTWTPQGSLSQPIPPNLKYKYPAPTKTTLLRIVIQLVEERAFYTQVLHLMNKMCLPPPFEELDEKHPELQDYYDLEKYKHIFDVTIVSKSPEATKESEEKPSEEKVTEEESQTIEEEDNEEESELESDEDAPSGPQLIIPEKRKKPLPKRPLKIPKFVNPLKQSTAQPTSSQKQKPEDLFDVPKLNTKSKKITVKPSTESASTTNIAVGTTPFIVQPSTSAEGFGLIYPAKKDEQDEVNEEKQEVITTEQLHNNKISNHDQRLLPVFKNYHPGLPSNRLYIKNLAKQVEESDLHFIYRRYILPSCSDTESEYKVRLMQEGRMKGQAFVTLPNAAQAQLALNETNGYLLKEKPMVVQFAKATKN